MKTIALILASGDGVRLGGPKALLEWPSANAPRGVMPLAGHHARERADVDRVVIVTRAHYAEALERCRTEGWRFDADIVVSRAPDEEGMAGSIAAAAAHFGRLDPDTAVLVTPVDCLPAAPELVAEMLARLAGHDVVRLRVGGRGGHPVLVRGPLLDPYHGGTPTLRDVLRAAQGRTVELSPADPARTIDIDHPGDHAALRDGAQPAFFAWTAPHGPTTLPPIKEASTLAQSDSGQTVGENVRRLDGVAKVTGEAHYVADLPRMDGELWGATVRSPVARGKLEGITFDPDFDWSDVTRVLAEDVPENVVQLIVDDQPILATDRVNHRYEPVVLLACADRAKLAAAVNAVKLEIAEEPAQFDIEASLAGGPVVWGEDNVQTRYLITKGCADEDREASKAAIDAAIDASDVAVRGRYTVHHQEQLYIEPQGVLAWWDDQGAHVTGSIQCPYYVHKGFKRCFDLEADRIHITQAVTGGGFGGKEEYPTLISLHASLLAKKSGKPVRLIYDRVEDIEATTKRHPGIIEIASGCTSSGELTALSVRVIFDAGAYVTLTPVVLSRGVLHAGGAYKWRDARIEGISVATNTPPNGAFRGFGAPQTIWAIERHIDRVAEALGRDAGDLKRQNLLAIGDTTCTSQELRSSVGGAECVEKAFAATDYLERRAAGAVVEGRKARGIGCSVFMHGGGFTGSGERMLKGRVAVDLAPGGSLVIRTASTDIGQGTETVFAQIAADAAEVPLERVSMVRPCTTHVPDSGPTVASRTVMVVGAIVEQAARSVAERVRAEVESGGGSFVEAADRLLEREGEVSVLKQYEPPGWVQWDDKTYKGDAYPVYAWACDVAEVEVDLDTFEVRVLRFVSAVDVGKAIHPINCKGQLEGGALQAIGWALSEEIVWRDGRIENPRMTNYIVPTALDAPHFETILVEHPYEHGPGGGAKGIGELPMDGGAPAVAAAIEHATGLQLDHLPLTPERIFNVWEAQQAQQGAAE